MKQDKENAETADKFGQANLAEDMETLAHETANALTETKGTMDEILQVNKMLLEKINSQENDIQNLKNEEGKKHVNNAHKKQGKTSNDEVFQMIKKLTETMTGKPARRRVQKTDKEIFYCWSHGFGTNPEHISCKCTRKMEGHIDNATRENRQGGSIKHAVRLGINL